MKNCTNADLAHFNIWCKNDTVGDGRCEGLLHKQEHKQKKFFLEDQSGVEGFAGEETAGGFWIK